MKLTDSLSPMNLFNENISNLSVEEFMYLFLHCAAHGVAIPKVYFLYPSKPNPAYNAIVNLLNKEYLFASAPVAKDERSFPNYNQISFKIQGNGSFMISNDGLEYLKFNSKTEKAMEAIERVGEVAVNLARPIEGLFSLTLE
ncbi:hypothetical protein [Paenibacillus sp. GP183]|uniref:hypothetical protein n=1 Tax=Paenibacillus sp. GP183 TaxID=1882751 RepID=UPI00089C9E41|nr:hypothetical protein [Paenibacillus sp. GP183]SEB43014.1 hypothetical protein SAMN05443246_0264 [Paenibacillus sp. GP183]